MDRIEPWPAPERRDYESRRQLIRRVRAEFTEMPCVRLTRAQARRLFGLRADVCDRVLAELVSEQTMYCSENDQFHAQGDASSTVPKERVPE